MLGRKKKLIEEVSFALDVVAGVLLLGAVYLFLDSYRPAWGRFLTELTGYPFEIQGVVHLKEQSWLFLAIVVNLFISLKLNRFYQLDLFAGVFEIAFQSLKGVAIGVALSAVFFYFFGIQEFNRSLLFGFAGLFFCYQVPKEMILRKFLLSKHYRSKPLEAILVCPAKDLEKRMEDFSQRHLASVKIKSVALTEGEIEDAPPNLRGMILGKIEALAQLLSKGRYDLVFVGEARRNPAAAQEVLDIAEEQGVEAWYFADFLRPCISRAQLDDYGGKPVIVYKTTSSREGQLVLKRCFDLLVAMGLLILMSPLFIAIAIAIKSTSRGPILFKQMRTGFRGKPFPMFKFRSMVMDAPDLHAEVSSAANEMTGPVFKRSDDPRITRVGRFLRRYSLDELPQLLNVLRGEMSLVGPRPLPVYETERFAAFRDHRRYSVLPGLTGLWQVSGRNRICDFTEWVRLDLEYIDSWSLWLDIVILARTLPAVLSGDGAK